VKLPQHPQVVTEEDVRRVALSLPGSVERPYNRLPSFWVRSNLFLRIHELPDAFFVAEPRKLFITPHYDGYPGILVRLSQVDLDELTEIVIESWRLCAPQRLLAAYDAEHPAGPRTA
jgi:hypothetical protein